MDKKDKISFFLPTLSGGGAEKVFVNLANEFCRQGIPIDMVLGRAEGPLLSDLSSKVRIVDLRVNHMGASIFGLTKYLKNEKPRILMSGLLICNLAAVVSKKLARVSTKVVTCLHSIESIAIDIQPFFKKQIFKLIFAPLMRKSDIVISVSQGVAEDFLSMVGTLPFPNKLKIIHNPIVNEKLLLKSKEPITEKWFKKNKQHVVLSVGRLTAAKDFKTLIQAFSIVKNHVSCQLLILGEGEDRAELENLIRDLGLANDILMPGFVNNPFKFMRLADILVVSSLRESFGNTIVEAMASGCQVVSTDCPFGPKEILQNGKWGRLAPVGDYRELGRTILAALKTNGQYAVEKRACDFSLDKIARQYLRAFE